MAIMRGSTPQLSWADVGQGGVENGQQDMERIAALRKAESLGSSGRKDDSGKLRYDLIPGRALEEVARVYTYGATKYGEWNWRAGMKWSRMAAAMLRHFYRFWIYHERYDSESGCHHLSSAIFCLLSLLEYDLCVLGEDDRVPLFRCPLDPTTRTVEEVDRAIG